MIVTFFDGLALLCSSSSAGTLMDKIRWFPGIMYLPKTGTRTSSASTVILFKLTRFLYTLRWRHNDHDGVSNHQPRGCLLNRLFKRRSKKTSKLRVTGLCAGNSPGPVNSPHKGPVTRKMLPFDDVIMYLVSMLNNLMVVCSNNPRNHRPSGRREVPFRFLIDVDSRVFVIWDFIHNFE